MMKRTSVLILSFGLIAVLCTGPAPAQAQEASLPAFTVLDLGPLDFTVGEQRAAKDVLQSVRNVQLRDVLMLQHEITMLTALYNWQERVDQLRETYEATGRLFTPPAPPRSLCKQVPPNSLCGAAYSDLAPDYMRKPAAPAPVPQTNDTAAAPVIVEEAPPAYAWADIRCMANACTAVVVDQDTGQRTSVIEGETLPDGTLVQSIAPQGVTLVIKGNATKIDVANAPSLSPLTSGAIKKELNDQRKSTQARLAEALESLPASAPIDVSEGLAAGEAVAVEAGVGPSGLF